MRNSSEYTRQEVIGVQDSRDDERVGIRDDERVGIVIGSASASEFLFVAEKEVPRWEYVSVRSFEHTEDGKKEVEVIAQVHNIIAESLALRADISFESAHRIVQAGLTGNRTVAEARVLGYIHNDVVYQPRMAVQPGKEVFLASEQTLRTFYSFTDDCGLHIGYLVTRKNVPVSISVDGFRRHIAIIAQTGAGKSYTAGVLIEELLKKGATIVVLDPHADHVFISQNRKGGRFSDRVSVFRTKESTSRYEWEIGIKKYEVRFADMGIDEIFRICRISESYTNIRKAVKNAVEMLNYDCSVENLIETLRSQSEKSGREDALKALKYVEVLRDFSGIFGTSTTVADDYLKPKHISVFDLSGLNDRVANYVAWRILNEIYEKKTKNEYKYPVFVFIEEAHRFVPNGEETFAKRILKRLAAEGRKFGIFLTLITQRPFKVDADALSQCNSQIIMRITNPEDQNAVRRSSERMSESLLNDLPGLNIGEAIIVGEVSRAPVIARIRQRETKEGGADIDTVALLKEASREADTEKTEMEISKEIKQIRSIMEF